MLINIIFILIAIFLLIWNISLIISIIWGAPTVYSKDTTIKKAFELTNLKPNQTVLDLGCGNARSLIIAAEQFKAKGIGVEISPYYFLLAKLNVFLKGKNTNIKIYFGNILFQEALIKKSDVIYLYLFKTINKKLDPIIAKNIKPGAKLVSVAFPISNSKPDLINQKPKLFLYKF